MSVENDQRVLGGQKRFRGSSWGGPLAAGVATVCLVAIGCGSDFEDCSSSRTCSPPSASGNGGEGGDNGAAAAGQATAGDAAAVAGSGMGGDANLGGTGPMCDGELTACEGECVDTASNPQYCGDCETACAEGSICEDGTCLSDDASLETLSLAPAKLSPAFSSELLTYEATFSYFEPHLALTAVPTAADATMSYADSPITSTDAVEITATPGDDVASVSVEVTAPSGKTQTYDVSLSRNALVKTYVKAFNSRAGFRFGTSVAIDGDTAVFGAPDEDSYSVGVDGDESAEGAVSAGAAYVAARGSNGKWVRQAYLKADASPEGDLFGSAVAVDGDTIAVGAPYDDSQGAVYIFVRAGSTWSQQAIVTEPTRAGSNYFGAAVALQGDRLIVSSTSSNLVAYQGGAAYSYTRTGTTWEADAQHPNPPVAKYQTYDGYGYRVSLSGERVAVSQTQGEKAIFVLLREASAWTVEGELTLPGGIFANSNIALDGDTLAATAPGVVHIFTRAGSSWTKEVSLTPFDAGATAGFGSSVALKGGLLAVASGCSTCAGGVSTFVRSGSAWKNGAFVTAAVEASDAFGASVAVSGNRIVAGAPGEDSNATSFNQSSANNSAVNSGAAFILE